MEHIFTFKMIVLDKKPSGGKLFSKDNLPESRKMEPFISGKGARNYKCGKCGQLILKSIRLIQVTDDVFKCPNCGSFNRIKV